MFTKYAYSAPVLETITGLECSYYSLSSNNASLFHGLQAVTGMIKMEIVFIFSVLF